MAVTGHMGFEPKDGIFRILMCFLSCMVLDHFMRMRRPGGAKMMSPLAR